MTVNSFTQNYVWASPNGSAGAPSMRALVVADIPSGLPYDASGAAATAQANAEAYSSNASNLTSGTVATGRISGSYTGITGVGTLTSGSIPNTLVTGLGTMSTQNSSSVAITGGSIETTSIFQVNLTGVAPPSPMLTSTGMILTGPGNISIVESFSYGGAGYHIHHRAEGTASAPTATSSGVTLWSIQARGYGTTGYSATPSGIFNFISTESYTDTAHGAQFSVSTAANGTAAARAALIVDQDGGTKAQFFIATKVYTVSTLPSVSGLIGARAMISDATLPITTGLGIIPTGGGSNIVPVYCDGTNWRIG